jgi:hypothetical protein
MLSLSSIKVMAADTVNLEEEEEFQNLEEPSTTTVSILQLPGVVTLTDDSFEHQTQASTGSTTGSWLIYFHTSSDDDNNNNNVPGGTFPDPSEWLEHHVVVGTIAANDGGSATHARFHISTPPNVFVYIHKGHYYVLPPVMDWNQIFEFCQQPESSSSVVAKPIPPPPSGFESIKHKFQSDPTYAIVLAGMLLLFGISFGIGAVVGNKQKQKRT